MTQPAVARFEAGGTVPTIPVLERLAHALDLEKVTSTDGSIYVDSNRNGWMDGDEALKGVAVSLTDPKTGAIVATVTSDGVSGLVSFRDIPAGRYLVVASGYRVLSDWHVIANVCSPSCNSGWTVQVQPD